MCANDESFGPTDEEYEFIQDDINHTMAEANRKYGCAKLGRLHLKINYINKTGYFCESCANELLQQALAVETEGQQK